MNTIQALYLLEYIMEYLSKYDLIRGELYHGLSPTAISRYRLLVGTRVCGVSRFHIPSWHRDLHRAGAQRINMKNISGRFTLFAADRGSPPVPPILPW